MKTKKIKCIPFDYSSYAGNVFNKSIKIKNNKTDIIGTANIHLKYTKDVALKRPPVFISKKRRVTPVKSLEYFDTDHKSDIWGHPNITGFIDTGDLLRPTLSRHDYRKDTNLKRLFKELRKLEDEISEFIKSEMKESTSNSFTDLENSFNENIKSIIKETLNNDLCESKDYRRSRIESEFKRYMVIPGEDSTIVQFNDCIGKDIFLKNQSKSNNHNSKRGFQISEEFIRFKKNESKYLKIKIDPDSEPVRDENGIMQRSELFDDVVVIYKKHKDFDCRIGRSSRLGEEKITEGLLLYITGEFLFHFINQSSQVENQAMKLIAKFTDLLYKTERKFYLFSDRPLNNLNKQLSGK